MQTILITGANRGIGLELTRQYAKAGARVFACRRRPEAADELNALAAEHGDLSIVAMDVADRDSIAQARAEIGDAAIDILINNAGHGGLKERSLADLDVDGWLETLHVNTIGPMQVCAAFLDNIRASVGKKILTISSLMGSITDASGGSYAYRTSKAGVNMAMHALSYDLASDGVIILLAHPGWVQTAMGGPRAPLPVADSATGLRQLIERARPEHNGGFFNYDGRPLPW